MALKPEEVRERYVKMRKRVKCLWTCAGVCLLASVTLPGMADSDGSLSPLSFALIVAGVLLFAAAILLHRCPVCGVWLEPRCAWPRSYEKPWLAERQRTRTWQCPNCRTDFETGLREPSEGGSQPPQ